MQNRPSLSISLLPHLAVALLGLSSAVAQTAGPATQMNVAIVVQNGMELLDFAWPGRGVCRGRVIGRQTIPGIYCKRDGGTRH